MPRTDIASRCEISVSTISRTITKVNAYFRDHAREILATMRDL